MAGWIQRTLGLRPRFKRIRRRKIAGLSRGAMSGQVISLEARILPAAVTNVADLNGDPDFQNDSSHAREYTTIGNRTFFTYNSQVTNKPLLAFTDSTTGRTTVLPDQLNFRFSPNTQISELTVFQGKLYFVATDGNPSMGLGKELWSLDPSTISIPPGSETATATFTCLTDFDGVHATTVDINGVIKTAINGKQTLTDGSTTANSKNEGSAPANLTVSGGKLYFTATDDLSGQGGNRELYFYDGTRVKLVRDINTNSQYQQGSSTPQQLTNAGGILYFTAVDTVNNGRELWRTDGTAAGTFLLKNIKPTGDGDITEITPANGTNVFFSANDGAVGNELWFSDGTQAGTRLVRDIQGTINGINQGSNPSSMLWVNGTLYFTADDGNVGRELWRSNGTSAGTVLVRDIAQTGPNGVFDVKQNSNPHNLTYVQETGLVYFSANDGKEGFELWRLDPASNTVSAVQTTAGPLNGQHPVPGINRTLTSTGDQTGGSFPGSLLNVGGDLYFIATNTYTQNGQTNFELWRVNRTTGLIEKAGGEINQLSNVWQSQFDIPDPQQDFTYAKSSSDAFRPTEVIADASPTGVRKNPSNRQLFLGPDGLIYFTADNGANGSKVGALGEYSPNFEPHAFNAGANNFNAPLPTPGTSRLVKDMTVQSLVSTEPFGFTTVGNRTFFFFNDTRLSARNFGLAYFDNNTQQVIDSGLRFDSVGTDTRPNPQVFGSTILFIANGKEVWRTNGTQVGTEVVATADVSIDLLTVSGSRYFYYGINYTFAGNNRSANGELWSGTTGSAAAEQVIEIAPTVQNFNRSAGINFIVPAGGNSVWFNANDYGNPNNGSRDSLWISNGTTDNNGTRIVVSAGAQGANNPTGPQGPDNPYAAASTPNVVYFAAGGSLYRSQIVLGANGVDQAATDLATRDISGFVGQISQITPVSNGVFFVVNGSDLYFSNGNDASGTVLVGNYFNLSDLTAVGDRLYFVDFGNVLYTTTVATLPTVTDLSTLEGLSDINNLVLTGTTLYFGGRTTGNGQELWVSNNGGPPTRVTDIQAGGADSLNVPDPFDTPHSKIGIGNGRVWFGANDLALGVENLSSIQIGGTTVTHRPDIVRPTTASSNARDFIILDVDSYGGFAQPTVYFFSDVGPQRSVLSALSSNPTSTTLTTIETFRNWGHSPGDLVFFDDYSAVDTQIEAVPTQYEHFGEYGHPQDSYGIYKSGKTATANYAGYLGAQFLFFSGFTSDNTGGQNPFNYGQELYVLWGGGVVRITDLRVASNTAQGNANPGYLTSIGNNADGESNFVLFAASSGPSAGALYKVTTTNQAPATFPVAQISSAVNPRYLQSLGGGEGTGGLVYFTAGAENARTAWVTDGFTAIQLSTAIVDESAGDGKIFGYSNGKVYFSARDANSDNFELHMTDHAQLAVTTGSPNFNNAQTRLGTNVTGLLREINTSTTAGSRPGNFTNVNGVMYFAANDGVHGFELWKTDGTFAGTVMVSDLEAGAAGSNPGVVITPKVSTDLNGVSTTSLVYTYQGFAVGNTRPDEFGVANAGINNSLQENPAKPNSGDNTSTPTLMFAATTTQYGRELFQVTPGFDFDKDGDSDANDTKTFTFSGQSYTLNANQIQIVKDIAPGSRSSNPLNLTAIDGTVYFAADDGLTGDTLWQSVGLDQITGNTLTRKMVDDVQDQTASNSPLVNGFRNPNDFTLLTTNNQTINRLIFTAANDLGKTELYQLSINHTPTLLSLSSNFAPEGSPKGTVIGEFSTADPDFGDTFQYQFVNGQGDVDNDYFQIVGKTLQVKRNNDTPGEGPGLDFELKDSYTVRIRTTDQRGQFYERSFTINVSDVNEAPEGLTFLDPTTGLELADGTARIDEIPSVAPADPAPTTQDILLATLAPYNDDAITANNVFSIVPGELDADSFVVDKRNGLNYQVFLKAGAVLNFEAKGQYQVKIQILDPTVPGMEPVERTFTLILNDINESPIGSVSDSDATSNTTVGSTVFNGAVSENATTGTVVGITAFAVDPDTQLNPVSYSLIDNAGGRFQIDPTTGVVSVLNGSLLNYEALTQHAITVLATSTDGSTSTATFNIRVLDVNEFSISGITDVDPAPNRVNENAPVGAPVGVTAYAVDNDGSTNTITYSLYSNAGGAFQIDPVTGVITVLDGSKLNRELHSQRQILVQATSADGSTSYLNVVIDVLDVNEFAVDNIIDTNPAAEIIPEHSPVGTPVGITAFAKDADATNNVVTYSLFNTRGGRFAIDPVTGVVTVANGAILDREAQASWTITVLATSQDGSIKTRDFTIQLSDVDEFDVGPVFDLNTAVNVVDENAANGTVVGITAFAIDLDPTSVITYSLSNDAGGRFQINPNSGVVTVRNGALLDREAAASHLITVVASSDDGSSSQANFTIALNDVNEFAISPITNAGTGDLNVLEHSAVGSQVGVTAYAFDADATNNKVTYSLTYDANGRFAINPITGVVTIANSVMFDREIAPTFAVTVKATSEDGSSSSRTYVINVIETNDNQVSNIVDKNTASDGNVGGIAFNGNVNEKAATGTLVGITAFATDADVGAGAITYSLQDTSGGRYKIDPVTGVVSVDDGTRIDYEAGTTNLIIVKATSGDGSFKTRTFTISVNDVYEAPEVTLTNKSVNENMAAGAVVGVLGVQNATASSPVYTLVSGTGSTNNSSFQIVGNQLRTKATFDFEAKSSYSVRISVTSANGVTATGVFIINVNNVNEAPTAVSLSKTSVKKSAPVGTVVGLLSGTDPDAGSTFNYTLVSGSGSTDNSKFTIVGNELRVNGALGTGKKSIRVRVTDQSGMWFEKTFSISLTN